LEVENPNYLNEEKIIEKAVILDARTIELSYNYDVVGLSYDIKILSELAIEDMFSLGNNILEIKLNTPLEKSSSYILMISSLEDAYGKEIVFDEMLYDFFTNDALLNENIGVEENINEEIVNIDENK
jgi:hypothetical protein